MNLSRIFAILAVTLTLAACGNNFEWFPKVPDTTPPVVTSSVSGNKLFINHTTHFNTLPVTITFAANEPATIYYTTSNSNSVVEPTTSSPSVEITSASGVDGPFITLTDTILKFFGVDKAAKPNHSATQTINIKSP